MEDSVQCIKLDVTLLNLLRFQHVVLVAVVGGYLEEDSEMLKSLLCIAISGSKEDVNLHTESRALLDLKSIQM